MLTKKQKGVLDFLNAYSKDKGYAPSLDEIRRHFKLLSVSTAHYYVKKLEEEGYLQKTSNQPRSINIHSNEILKTIIPKSIETFSIPVLGSANAGPATALAEENKNTKNGDYILSIIDNYANLKKFEENKRTGEIRLLSESKNSAHKPIYVSSEDNFIVNGKIISVVKK